MSPISIVENESLKALNEGVRSVIKPSKIKSCRTCNEKIGANYIEYKENLKVILKTVDFVYTTADVWLSS